MDMLRSKCWFPENDNKRGMNFLQSSKSRLLENHLGQESKIFSKKGLNTWMTGQTLPVLSQRLMDSLHEANELLTKTETCWKLWNINDTRFRLAGWYIVNRYNKSSRPPSTHCSKSPPSPGPTLIVGFYCIWHSSHTRTHTIIAYTLVLCNYYITLLILLYKKMPRSRWTN